LVGPGDPPQVWHGHAFQVMAIRELIALAVAVTARCDGCIAVHTEAAIRHGATKEEIAEALGVAVAVNAGAALVYSTRVMDAVKEYPHANAFGGCKERG
jgi:AhpD family alkylhydroperoxidase